MLSTLTTYPPLTPIVHDWMRATLRDTNTLRELVEQYGSPINLLDTTNLVANQRDYAAVFAQYNLDQLIFFARKANKVQAFVAAASANDFGVDTASYRELEQALAVGCPAEKLVSTAAIKNRALLELAFKNDVLVILDNADEFALAQQIAAELNKNVKTGIRLSGFYFNNEKLYSRFGIDLDVAEAFILDWRDNYPNLIYTGIHFHLNGYSRAERGAALAQSIQLAEGIATRGYNTQFIDIGGGLLMNYLRHRSEWDEFHHALRAALRGERPPVTFGNQPLGIQLVEGELHGEPSVYPYYNEAPQAVFLKKILNYTDESDVDIPARLRANNIQLRLEPGRSLLDGCGMTVAKVAFRKVDSRGDLLIGLEMNRTQMFSSSADYLLDPIVLPMSATSPNESPTSGYFVGAYCLEQDLILKRKINLERTPEIGDLVCFFNTAGYMMHFYETEAHLFPLSTNLVRTENGWKRDEETTRAS